MAKSPASRQPIRIGRYVLHGELAAGGMAAVHFGRLLGEGGFAKTVAIKRLHRQLARDPAFRESILEEGRLAARIRHPNVVPPLDVLSEGGELLLVMEYVHGESLSRLMRTAWKARERIALPIGAAILSNVLHGLHAAHEAKDEQGRALDIVHRDVSPQNVLVGVDGIARVIDFGIAKAATSGESTSTGVIKGKVPYLAPEQLEGDPATRRTDVYAASVVLWEVLAGKRLFSGEDDSEILRKIVTMTVDPPSKYDPSIPREMDEVVLTGLARAPRDRFATARDMALELEAIVHLATSSVVGAWVEKQAAAAIATRAAELASVESSDRESAPPPASLPPPRGPTTRPPPPRALPASLASVDPAVTYASRTVAAPIAELSAAPDARLISDELPAPSALAAPARTPSAFPVPASPPHRLPAAGELSKPALEIANVEWLPQSAAPKPETSWLRRTARVGLVALVLLLILGFATLPMIIKEMVVARAEERGVHLEVGRVEVSRRAVRLIDVRATGRDFPGLSAHASTIEVGIARLAPARIAIADIDVTLEGAYTDVRERAEHVRATTGPRLFDWASDLQGLSIGSGRLDWRTAFGPGSSVLIENVSLEMERAPGRALGDDYHLAAPLVTVRSGAASAGPWRVDAEARENVTQGVLKLDPLGMYPAKVSWTDDERGQTRFDFAVSSVRLRDIHLPETLLDAATSPVSRLEIRGQIVLGPPAPTGRPVQGRLFAEAKSLAIFPASPPLDVELDLPIAGDANKPVPVAGALAITSTEVAGMRKNQHAAVALAGRLDAAPSGVGLELAGRSTAVPCTGRGETQVDVHLAVDVDKLGEAKVSLQPTAPCPPRLR